MACQAVAGWTPSFLRYGLATIMLLSTCPLLLLLDGHSRHFHFQPGFEKKAANKEVVVFRLPPHTTHLTHSLDKGVFGRDCGKNVRIIWPKTSVRW